MSEARKTEVSKYKHRQLYLAVVGCKAWGLAENNKEPTMNGYEFLMLTIEFVNDGMSIDEAYQAAKEVKEAIDSIESGSLAEIA